MEIMPSLLAAPSLELSKHIENLIDKGFKTFHIDMMDYHYTHNFGLTPQICQDILKQFPEITLDVHLMTNPTPEHLIQRLQDMGVTDIAIHPQTMKAIPEGFRVALSPNELSEASKHSRLLFLTVNPGFSYQKMDTSILAHAKKAKEKGANITIDGGINLETLDQVLAISPDNIVIGGGLFNQDKDQLLSRLRSLLNSKPQH